MAEPWSAIVRQYRLRHGLTQQRLAEMLNVAQRTISRWERGEDAPSLRQQKALRDLTRMPDTTLSARLFQSVANCPMPRALSRTPRITLQALSRAAILKRPSVVEWVGRDLAPIATGVLAEKLDDGILQRSITGGEIACVHAITQSVLRTPEHERIGTFETTVTYFFHDGTLYSDAISAPAGSDARCSYRAIPLDEALEVI
jgi:transcriptional regulator with XRE-family HTH domain